MGYDDDDKAFSTYVILLLWWRDESRHVQLLEQGLPHRQHHTLIIIFTDEKETQRSGEMLKGSWLLESDVGFHTPQRIPPAQASRSTPSFTDGRAGVPLLRAGSV